MQRREFVTGAGALAVAAATAPIATRTARAQVPFSSGTEAPRVKAPPHACDSHMHIYDSRFPIAATATLRPPDAHVSDYRLLQKRIGTTRNVIVTPSTYGTDNSCTSDALQQIGPSARGVAVVDTSVTDAQLKQLSADGFRGIRFNLVQAGATTLEMIEPLSKRVNDLGWHVQVHMTADQIVNSADLFARLPSVIVFDHLGRIPEPAGVSHPAFTVILKLIDKGRTWVKLSGAYQDTKAGPPTYADSSAMARAYVKAAPQRLVWGTDWPHPTEKINKPDDAILFDLLDQWAPEDSTKNRILVTNPEELYGFDTAK